MFTIQSMFIYLCILKLYHARPCAHARLCMLFLINCSYKAFHNDDFFGSLGVFGEKVTPCDGVPINIIEAEFYSLGMYRRGGIAQANMRRVGGVLKFLNMAGGGLKIWATSPWQSITMRALWRTASTSHFFVCRYGSSGLSRGEFYLFTCPCFGMQGVQVRGCLITFSKRGDYTKQVYKRGVIYPPPCVCPVCPRFAKE
jgi:hypothetical protein